MSAALSIYFCCDYIKYIAITQAKVIIAPLLRLKSSRPKIYKIIIVIYTVEMMILAGRNGGHDVLPKTIDDDSS